jgi:formate hydrogenlyase subunit 3/multisubunit Na+/H+ antiporter MnhD subunit
MTPVEELVLLLMTPLVPLGLALVLLRWRDSRVLQTAAALGALPGLVTSALMPAGIAATLPWLLEGSEFGLDVAGRLFLFFSAAIWLAAGLHARQSVPAQERGRFFAMFLLVMSGNLGLIVARDMLAFYLFFVLMSFAAYGLIVHDSGAAARRAGRVYMTFVVAGDMLLFAALVLAAVETGGTLLFTTVRESLLESEYRDAVIALVIAGFGVKLGVLGLHVTLPLIYRAAATPAAAVLAGAMINTGLLAWLRFLPLGAEVGGWSELLIVAGVAAAFYGVLIGVTQRDAPTVLAYSSVSQMGVMTAGVGAALATEEHSAAIVAAILVYAMHHAFAKSALFLGAGIAAGPWPRRSQIHAIRVALLLPALALTGAPLTSGMLAKEYLKESMYEVGMPAVQALAALLPWTAFATTLVVARFLWLAWPRSAAVAGDAAGNRFAARAAPWAALLLLTATAVWLLPLDDPPGLLTAGAVWDTLWPVVLGAAVAAAIGFAAATARLPRLPGIPPGDVVVGYEWLARRVAAAFTRFSRRQLPDMRDALQGLFRFARTSRVWPRLSIATENLLGQWSVAVALFIALAVVLVVVTIWI